MDLVERLVASQFPQWAGLPVTTVDLDGWDNSTFRLGESMSVRLPSADAYGAQVDKEHRWLPFLAPRLPVPIPVPLGRGEPTALFPRPWSVYGWIDGDLLAVDRVVDMTVFASELAGFLSALYVCEPVGPAPGSHSFSRGGSATSWDEQTRQTLQELAGVVDVPACRDVWQVAVEARSEASGVWVHGDVTGANLLVRDGHLAGVLDFGCCAVGDPACDLTIAWTFFSDESRDVQGARAGRGLGVGTGTWLGTLEGATPPCRRTIRVWRGAATRPTRRMAAQRVRRHRRTHR